ncbi:HAD family hydrolase [Dasania sp. GY-MA-18]|uniref:HAD family hydrolase n=1 Tax=Dasania phycosphaerae TaxID=2950436 RepID=A0A9J6RN32_9GAMM|nr:MULTISPECIES: HAD family hydrolase [Dasania]MCR8923467.1 HAD family hydrolase [Dasania sp. GY-MA-18]MCZ0865900.1 HAD family hydrolase [Dasania phycosphaerae]MCZ0869624.1 HAD family hydrolase [Dasania phycosphaerae]
MLKALFLDMDETLCDTLAANAEATQRLGQLAQQTVGAKDGQGFAEAYVAGIYRQWSEAQAAKYLPIAEVSEQQFRLQLIRDLLAEQHISQVPDASAQRLLDCFDNERLAALKFYPGIVDFLINAKKLFTLVVITNGPEYSQIPKLDKLKLADYVDHIIIGGQEPEQKPARSIFEKALTLANCEAHEAIHVGDNLAADIAGAHSANITSVWIQHQQPLDAELGINPHHTLISPDEIPALIRELHPH